MNRISVARLSRTRIMVAFMCLLVFCHLGQAQVFAGSAKILFFGNSITHHGPSPDIGWYGDWGMAASSADKDYVHRVVTSIGAVEGVEPTMMIGSAWGFEVGYNDYDIETSLQAQLDFKADIVVVQLGENVTSLTTPESQATFKSSFERLLTAFETNGSPSIFLTSNFWPEDTIDGIKREVAAEVGAAYVNISGGFQEEYYARSERYFQNSAVGVHPGDLGMELISGALFASIEPTLLPEPGTPALLLTAILVSYLPIRRQLRNARVHCGRRVIHA